jgi:hypothetical protein
MKSFRSQKKKTQTKEMDMDRTPEVVLAKDANMDEFVKLFTREEDWKPEGALLKVKEKIDALVAEKCADLELYPCMQLIDAAFPPQPVISPEVQQAQLAACVEAVKEQLSKEVVVDEDGMMVSNPPVCPQTQKLPFPDSPFWDKTILAKEEEDAAKERAKENVPKKKDATDAAVDLLERKAAIHASTKMGIAVVDDIIICAAAGSAVISIIDSFVGFFRAAEMSQNDKNILNAYIEQSRQAVGLGIEQLKDFRRFFTPMDTDAAIQGLLVDLKQRYELVQGELNAITAMFTRVKAMRDLEPNAAEITYFSASFGFGYLAWWKSKNAEIERYHNVILGHRSVLPIYNNNIDRAVQALVNKVTIWHATQTQNAQLAATQAVVKKTL